MGLPYRKDHTKMAGCCGFTALNLVFVVLGGFSCFMAVMNMLMLTSLEGCTSTIKMWVPSLPEETVCTHTEWFWMLQASSWELCFNAVYVILGLSAIPPFSILFGTCPQS